MVSSRWTFSLGYLRRWGDRAMRSPELPEVPAISEFVPGYEASGWAGIGAPRDTPPEVIDVLNKAINAGLTDTKMKGHFADLGGCTPFTSSPIELRKFIADDAEKWGQGDPGSWHQGAVGSLTFHKVPIASRRHVAAMHPVFFNRRPYSKAGMSNTLPLVAAAFRCYPGQRTRVGWRRTGSRTSGEIEVGRE
jgi:tripartite tricarboxylate transporter family receptor